MFGHIFILKPTKELVKQTQFTNITRILYAIIQQTWVFTCKDRLIESHYAESVNQLLFVERFTSHKVNIVLSIKITKTTQVKMH